MCGVFGVVLPGGDPTEAAAIAALGLFALQHRGQESAGLAVSDGDQLMLYKDLGMVGTVLDERRLPSLLRLRLRFSACAPLLGQRTFSDALLGGFSEPRQLRACRF